MNDGAARGIDSNLKYLNSFRIYNPKIRQRRQRGGVDGGGE